LVLSDPLRRKKDTLSFDDCIPINESVVKSGKKVPKMFENKNILIIGGTGSVGRTLLSKLLSLNPNVVRVFSRDEFKQFEIEHDLLLFSLYENGHKIPGVNKVRFLIGDVRDKDRVSRAMEGIDIVFNVAAMKHVPACEYNPFEAVKTNVIGVQNVIECALKLGVETVVYTSTDKAASPTNTMGATKLLAERIMSAAQFTRGPSRTKFATVRFGNILMSRGSVLPLFIEQSKKGKPLTLTDPLMTRFVMTKERAVELILKAAQISLGGETFVLKMPVVKMGDVARGVGEFYGNDRIEVIGKRPGEKLYEELMTEEESMRALEFDEMFGILPFFGEKEDYENFYKDKATTAAIRQYSTEDEIALSYQEVKNMIWDILRKEEAPGENANNGRGGLHRPMADEPITLG
jgi:FlaA1/EpsC-like NDP-sugar epimerase